MEKKNKVEKKKIAAARLASILASCWTENRLFFMDSLTTRFCHKFEFDFDITIIKFESTPSLSYRLYLGYVDTGWGGRLQVIFTSITHPQHKETLHKDPDHCYSAPPDYEITP